MQGGLIRIDVAARQLELVLTYLASDDEHATEPSLSDADLSPAAISLKIIQAQEGERQHLAEEVHDGPAQVLTNAIFQVEYLDRVLEDSPETAHAELAFLRTMLREGLEDVRSFIAVLRPPSAEVGLKQAITEAGAEFAAKHGIAVDVSVPGIDARVPAEAKAPILRIVQEALQNVRKHAAATAVRIALEADHLVIVDNGRGFDVMRLASATRNFGLQFMRERAELMGSSLQIESRQGEGTRILLRIPEVR
jgi:two-component system sensor histidine kinase DegS